MIHTTAVSVLCIAVGGVVAQWVAWRLKLPAIVLLFAVGLVVGPWLGVLEPARTFGAGLQPMVGLAVAIVVFEGGLALDMRELRAAGQGVARLTMVAPPISFVLAAAAAHVVAGMGWTAAMLYGAITVVTGPTVVLPLIRNTRLARRAASFLKWEAIVNDPVGALLAAIVLALMLAGGQTHGALAGSLAIGLVVSLGLGIGAALLVQWLVRNDQAPETLKTPILLALALGVYAVSNLAIDGAGLAAATIFGIALANLHIPGIAELTRFKEALVVLLVSALFVVLTASLDRSLFTHLSWPVLLLTAAMVFVVRPVAIALATLRSGLSWKERLLAGWIAPRGIVAAAVAGVASTKLAAAGVAGAEEVMPAVFALIAATMVLHGFTLAPLARRLGLTLGERPGLAILGASPWTVDLAAVLQEAGTPVVLIDTFPGALDAARKRRIPVVQAEIMSEHGEEELSGRRIDYLIAATPNDVYNSLVCAKLGPELGRSRVFQLAPAGGDIDDWVGLDREWRGLVVGRPAFEFAATRRRFKEGWRFALREHVDADDGDDDKPATLDDDCGEEAIGLLALRRNGDLAIASREGGRISVAAGDRILALVAPGADAPESRADVQVA